MMHRNALPADAANRIDKGNIRSLKSLWKYMRPYRLAMLGAGLALIITSSAVLGLGGALKYLVDKGLSSGDPALLDNAFTMLLAVTIILACASYARFYLVSWVGERTIADMRRELYSHVIRLDIPYFETTRIGEILSRITTDTTLLQSVVGSTVSVALRNSLMAIGGIVLLLITSATLAEYVFFMLPLVVLPIILLGRKVRGLSRETQNRIADVSANAEETLSAIRTIQALSLEGEESQKFADAVNVALNTALSRVRTRSFLTALVILLVFGAVVSVLWIGGRDVMAGRITPGELSSFLFYSVVVAGSIGALSEVVGDLQRAAGAAERMIELLQEKPVITSPPDPLPLPQPVTGRIDFDNITFRYPSRPATASLDRFNLSIAPGETVALVGPSGAGKSTVLQLLLRFYDPTEGSVKLEGIDLRRLSLQELRRQMGMVPQDPVIFSVNAMDNIRCGNVSASDEEVKSAAEAAAAREFIEALPQGFNTFLGEKGVRLSGGQRQRIAIARAIVRNPRILLLDEATSALDSENETLVQKALEKLMRDRTTLVIAHRLSTVLKADRIIVMNEGRIEATGTHTELLTSSPLYKRHAELQFDLSKNAA